MGVRRRTPTVAVGLLILVATLSWSGRARAHCRTTTCAVAGCVSQKCLEDDVGADQECASACPPARCQARDEQGCLSKGIPIFWSQRCLSFSVESSGSPRLGLGYDDLLPVVQSGFALWSEATCDQGTPAISIISLGTLTCHAPEFNRTGPNANGVIFQDEAWPYGPEVMGLTKVSFNGRTGQIFDADIQINTLDYGPLFTPEGLSWAIAHEIGHFLGLDHSLVGDALMYPRADAARDVGPALTSDDAAGICAVYPPSLGAPVCDAEPHSGAYEPAKGFAPDCGGDVIAACALAPGSPETSPASIALVLAAATLAGVRRRRPRTRRRSPAAVGRAGARDAAMR